MSGQIRGKIECRHSVTAADSFRILQEYFKNIYDFLVSHPSFGGAPIARHSGTGSVNGDIAYWDQANPFRTKAWYVFRNQGALAATPRAWDWYVMIQLIGRAEYPNSGVSAPCLIRAQDYDAYGRLAIQFAIGTTGDPWNGGVGGDGQGVKGSPVWKNSPLVFGRSNNPGGSYTATKQNMTLLWNTLNSDETRVSRTGIIADDDFLVLLYSAEDDLQYRTLIFSPFTPRTGLTLTYPAVMMHRLASYGVRPDVTYGGTAGNGDNDGGVVHRDYSGVGVRNVFLDYPDGLYAPAHQPNPVPSPPDLDLLPMPLLLNESPYYGFIGQLDEKLLLANSVHSTDTSTDQMRIFLGPNSQYDFKDVFPWDGSNAPRSGTTRSGINFSRAP